MEKNTKQWKSEKAQAEEAAINRILTWVVGGSVLEFLLLLLNRYWTHYTAAQIELRLALGTAVRILAVASLVCAAAAIFWWNSMRKSGKGGLLPGVLAIFLVGVSLSCFAAWFFSGTGIQAMYVAVPVVIVLVLIYYLYQREFFLTACQSALALLGIWMCDKGLGGRFSTLCYVYVVLAALAILAAAYLCRVAQGNGGMVTFQGNRFRLFGKKTNYALLYVGSLLLVIVLLLAALGISQVVLLSVTVAWLLIMAVYYTVKLM